MMTVKYSQRLFCCLICFFFLTCPGALAAAGNQGPLSLADTIAAALAANLNLKRSRQEVKAARASKNVSRSNFLPTFNATYQLLHRDKELTQSLTGIAPVDFVVAPQDTYTFVTSFTQPIFSGFAILNQYRIASLGLDVAEISEKLTRQDVILDAKNAYYSVLKAQKLMAVARKTVSQIAAQKEVAENFYQVGMSPLNDLLQSQVQLANARQQLIRARNNLEVAKAQFNTVLRRPVNTPVNIQEELDYKIFNHDIDYCLKTAQQNRLEIKVADLQVQIAEKQVKLSEKNYFPSINVIGKYTWQGDDWDVNGGEAINDTRFWNIEAVATWDFWEWGRTLYGRKEKLSRLSQSEYQKSQIVDNINLEVKQSYLRTKEAEKNIVTVEKAIEQARENLRITQERYREQVATQTDVLVAQTLLTDTMTNYYEALYNFKIAKAILLRALGQGSRP